MLKGVLKRKLERKIIISLITLFLLLIIYLLPEKKSFEETVVYNDNFNYIYVLSDKNLLVRTSVISNESDILNKVKEIITSLTINGKVSQYLDKKLTAIIPEDTKIIELDLIDGVLKINFSKDLLNIDKRLEEKLVESLVYSLTELDEINGIMIFVEGNILNKLPNSNKSLPILLTRDFGINKVYNITNISSTSMMTIYYFTNIGNNYKVVPVTIFSNNDNDKIEVIVKNLKSSSFYQSDLVSFLNNNIQLLDYELEENRIKLDFNNALLDSFYDDSLLEEVKYAIAKSFEDSLNIDEVLLFVNGKEI